MRTTVFILASALGGCAIETAPDHHGIEGNGEPVAEVTSAISVSEAAQSSCTTTSVKGLSVQIVGQMNCIVPNAMAEVPERPNASFGAAVFPYMQSPAKDALVAALDANPSTSMTVNSMFRTVAQQYLLYLWSQQGKCGIGLAATPGNSNHESGLAIDISQYSTWQAALEAQGFEWFGSSDAVHFDYAGPGIEDLKGYDVLAFQMLWNHNHPSDPITEDGDYGPATEARMEQSPAEGFAQGPSCGTEFDGGAGSGGAGAGGVGGAAGTAGSGGSGATGGASGSAGSGGGAGSDPGPGQSSSTLSGDDGSCRIAPSSGRGRPGAFAAALLLALALTRRGKRAKLHRH
jgi:hypothetical protein